MFYWAKTDKYTIKNCHCQNIIAIIIIIMFYWAKTDKYTIKNCHSQNIIAINAEKDGKKENNPSKSPIHKQIKIKLMHYIVKKILNKILKKPN
jgi:hypothetical protein